VARGSLRRYDVQANWSVLLSIAAVIPLIAVLGLLYRNYNAQLNVILFGNQAYMLCVVAGVGAAMLFSMVGILLGFNSAGQRRNEQQRRSWAGFFIGAFMMSLAIIVLAAFWFLKMRTGA
jgi:hypothetical protein